MSVIETGKVNAEKFIRHVIDLSRDGRVIVIYAEGRHERWPWMRNPAWQNLVLDGLQFAEDVRDAQFHPADNVDGLCFSAISTAGDSRIERLHLDQVLDGRTPPTGRWARLKWMFTSMVGVFW